MYATIDQANEYVQTYYSSAHPLRTNWEALSIGDQQVLLNRAEQLIDTLTFTGKPLEEAKAFPRDPRREESLLAAKTATIELALQSQDSEATERFRLQSQGVRSYRIGDLSETFINGMGSGDQNPQVTYAYSIVYPFLKGWFGGGYSICHTHNRR